VRANYDASEAASGSLLVDPDFHLFATEEGPHLLLVDGSQVFKIDDDLERRLTAARASGRYGTQAILAEHGLGQKQFGIADPLIDPPVRALSLAVAERCNLGCTYCYAEGGSFGGAPRNMPQDIAEAAVRRLFAEAQPGERLNLAFLGGEPLVNRSLIQRTTELAVGMARGKNIPIGFSITTNGTLLNAADAEFFERYGFSVTVSLDGIGPVHDRLRPTKGGRGSYDKIMSNVQQLLALQRRMQVSARVTVTPANLGLRTALDHFVDLGFRSIGFSPMLSAPSGRGEMQGHDLDALLEEMIACGQKCEQQLIAGEDYPFSNLLTALEQIHRGTHRPYPCGAGAGYFGVSASGGLFACHRFVEDDAAAMGNVEGGVDRDKQRTWLAERMVDRQEPCKSCWARYLCGGGCHYEVIHRGRPACDYIRGWLDYALGAYVRISAIRPDLFSRMGSAAAQRPEHATTVAV
jgi:uncharacterized protein